MSFFYLLLSLLPSFVQSPIRNAFGARIARGARVSAMSLVAVKKLEMEPGARIGPFVSIRAESVRMERGARIRPLSKFKVRVLSLGRDASVDPMVLVNCDYGPRSRLELGRAVRVFSFSVLEPSEGISVDDHSGLGGHCLIFCHGSWPNYLEGAPYSRGPVKIGREVWIPWRVMILPNTVIGDRAIIGAHSLVRGDVPARALYSGVPARQVLENAWTVIDDPAEKERRLGEVLESFHAFHDGAYTVRLRVEPLDKAGNLSGFSHETVYYTFDTPGPDRLRKALKEPRTSVMDLANLYSIGPSFPIASALFDHLKTFGVRLSRLGDDEVNV